MYLTLINANKKTINMTGVNALQLRKHQYFAFHLLTKAHAVHLQRFSYGSPNSRYFFSQLIHYCEQTLDVQTHLFNFTHVIHILAKDKFTS